jgi:uncharacterized repeat protein (TIGR01451 family)
MPRVRLRASRIGRLLRSLVALLAVAAIGTVPTSSASEAVYIFGARYTGSHSAGGTVEFTVVEVGGSIRGFGYTRLPIGCNTSLSSSPARDVVPIVNDSFSFSGPDGNSYSGTFSGLQSARGTLTWTGPFCEGNHPVVTWTATTTAPLVADLALTMRDSPDAAVVGAPVTYTTVVANRPLPGVGASSAPGITVTQTVPDGATFASASASQGGCTEAAGVVACQLGAIASGADATTTLVVVPTLAGRITTSASVASVAQDPNAADNSVTEETTVQPLCVVPNVVGRTLAAARRAIARGHCRTGRITRAYSRRVEKGLVLAQRPRPRTRLVPDAANVNLVVSRGPRRNR